MDEMQQLMELVTRLQRRGVDVQRLLGGPGAIMDLPAPEMRPFTGPGPGATVSSQDMDMAAQMMERERRMNQNPMRGLLELMGRR